MEHISARADLGASVVAALVVSLLLLAWFGRDLNRLFQMVVLAGGSLALAQVRPRMTALAAWTLRNLCFSPEAPLWSWHLRAYAAADLGHSRAAGEAARTLLSVAEELLPTECPWLVVNVVIDVFVSSGLYAEAATASARWSTEAQELGRQQDPRAYCYAQINTAEALFNRGDEAEALALLDGLTPGDRLSTEGAKLLRAWILAHRGEAEAARALAAEADPDTFGPRYAAEAHYTRSAAARALGDLDEAEREAAVGLGRARRAASRRNGLHMLGAALFARGEVQGAIEVLERFARSDYHGQAGPGLVLLGSAHEKAGRTAEARAAYGLAIERDPQSSAVAAARERLGCLAVAENAAAG